jgi:hypothetical protein
LACSRDKKATDVASQEATPLAVGHWGKIREVPVDLSGEAGDNRCQVNPVSRVVASPNDIVRWAFTVKTDQCKRKRIKVHKHGNEIDCTNGTVVQQQVTLPLESCERDDQKTGDLNSTIRLTCSVPPDFDGLHCYKYTIGGEVFNGDPEIEIERPRLSPYPMSTPAPTPTR